MAGYRQESKKSEDGVQALHLSLKEKGGCIKWGGGGQKIPLGKFS